MKTFGFVIYTMLQWTWGVFQNLFGVLCFLVNLNQKHTYFNGAIVTTWHCENSLGCGMWIFLSDDNDPSQSASHQEKQKHDLLVHEYGHTLQSIILGPLFLPVIAIPSLVWASFPFFRKIRKKKKISYYWLYTEKWANVLGDKFLSNQRMEG